MDDKKENQSDPHLEEERRRFEQQLEEQELELMLGISRSNYNSNPVIKTKYSPKKLLITLLISLSIVFIILIWMQSYASKHYTSKSDETLLHVYNMLNVVVPEYCKKYKKYPMNQKGEVDFELLRNKGYWNLDVEVDNSYFMLGNNCRVILRQPD